jgi:phosphate transport system permease protein
MNDPTTTLSPDARQGRRQRRPLSGRARWFTFDNIVKWTARSAGLSIIILLGALLVVLTIAAWPSITKFGFSFLYETDWRPNELEIPLTDDQGNVVLDEDGEVQTTILEPVFGAAPVIWGTAVSSLIALIIAVPLSFGTALFLVRSCPKRLAAPISFLVEFLAAIPSIAYGIWGLFILAPFLRDHVEPGIQGLIGWIPLFDRLFFQNDNGEPIALNGRDMFCGGLVLAIMILPIITAVSRDVLKSVPRAQIEGTLALGATWWQSSREMLRYSRSALFGAVMLGLGRAAGETMAVTMVIGNANKIDSSPFAPAQTMSSLLANEFAEASSDLHTAALVEVALILLVMSLGFSLVARWLVVGGGSQTSAAH